MCTSNVSVASCRVRYIGRIASRHIKRMATPNRVQTAQMTFYLLISYSNLRMMTLSAELTFVRTGFNRPRDNSDPLQSAGRL
jgi:hypothetical protein